MLQTSCQSSNLAVYEEMKDMFDWNKTPIAPLGTKAMIYSAPDVRNTCASHCNEAFVTSMAPHHYCFLKLFVPATRGYGISGACRLNSTHWTVPTVSEADHTVLATTNFLKKLETMPPTGAIQSTPRPMRTQPPCHQFGTSTTAGGGNRSTKGDGTSGTFFLTLTAY
jgi:hypothetical protein